MAAAGNRDPGTPSGSLGGLFSVSLEECDGAIPLSTGIPTFFTFLEGSFPDRSESSRFPSQSNLRPTQESRYPFPVRYCGGGIPGHWGQLTASLSFSQDLWGLPPALLGTEAWLQVSPGSPCPPSCTPSSLLCSVKQPLRYRGLQTTQQVRKRTAGESFKTKGTNLVCFSSNTYTSQLWLIHSSKSSSFYIPS